MDSKSKMMRERRTFLKQALLSCAAIPTGCGDNGIHSTKKVGDQTSPSVRTPSAYTAFSPRPKPPSSPIAFPLRRASDKRYLVDSRARPVLINGDSAWSLLVQLTREKAELYLEDRRTRGFNAVLVSLLEHHYASDPPRNRYGDAPFTSVGDYSAPNEKYFAHVDWVLQKAAEKGILVMLAPSYIGSMADGWYQEMVDNGSAVMHNFGRYLGQRYRNFTNIMWVHGGDADPPSPHLLSQIALGIREFDKIALHTAHAGRERPAMDFWGSAPWMQVNNVYSYEPVFRICSAAYSRMDRMPFFLIESAYEGERGTSDVRIRAQAWHAVLSGAMGQLIGNNPIWHFDCPVPLFRYSLTWRESLNSEGARSMTQLRRLFDAYPWWQLEPDFDNSLLTDGISAEHDRAVAARSIDGAFAFAFVPSRREVKVALNWLAGPRVGARWYDPVVGKFVAIPAMPVTNVGRLALTPPSGGNGGGDEDWVLVLESTV